MLVKTASAPLMRLVSLSWTEIILLSKTSLKNCLHYRPRNPHWSPYGKKDVYYMNNVWIYSFSTVTRNKLTLGWPNKRFVKLYEYVLLEVLSVSCNSFDIFRPFYPMRIWVIRWTASKLLSRNTKILKNPWQLRKRKLKHWTNLRPNLSKDNIMPLMMLLNDDRWCVIN